MLVPMVIEKTQNGERSFDIYSRLLKDRIVMLTTDVNEHSASLIVAQLLFLEAEDAEKEKRLKENYPVAIKATFLGAHAFPMEYKENHQAYIDLIISEMLPAIA